MLQVATGINPILTGARMGIKSWEFEVFQFADKEKKKLVRELFDKLDN